MNSSLIIIAGTAFVMFYLLFGIRKAPGIFLSVAATLSGVWVTFAILTA